MILAAATGIGGFAVGWLGQLGGDLFRHEDAADAIRNGLGMDALRPIGIPQRDDGRQGGTYVLPDPLPVNSSRTIEGPRAIGKDGDRKFLDWIQSVRGTDPLMTFVNLVVENRYSQQVQLLNVRAEIVSRTDPLSGTMLAAWPQAGGGIPLLGLNLDLAKPVACEVDGDALNQSSDPHDYVKKNAYFVYNKHHVEGQSIETFEVIAGTASHYCEFNILVDYLVGSKSQTARVDAAGRPFRVTAVLRSPSGDSPYSKYKDLYVNDIDTDVFQREDPQTYDPRR